MRAPLLSIWLVALGCAPGVNTVKIGDPVPLRVEKPRDSCEKARLLQVIPSRTFAAASQSYSTPMGGGWTWTTTTSSEQAASGYALYRLGTSEALNLPDLLPKLGNPDLTENHMQRIQPIIDRDKVSSGWRTAGLVIAGISLGFCAGALATIDDEDISGIMIGGALLSLVAELVVFGVSFGWTPSVQEYTYLGLRQKLFLPGEDDPDKVVATVDEYNEQVRADCMDGAPATAR